MCICIIKNNISPAIICGIFYTSTCRIFESFSREGVFNWRSLRTVNIFVFTVDINEPFDLICEEVIAA
jgi:hypothetical protein